VHRTAAGCNYRWDIAALLGLLGIDAWVGAKSEKALAAEVAKFDVNRKSYEESVRNQLLLAVLLSHVQAQLVEDQSRYELEVHRVEAWLQKH
jgi:hypothetical protein